MRLWIGVALIGAAIPCDSVVAQDSAQIAQAIERGAKSKNCAGISKTARPFGRQTGFEVSIQGPLNMVECVAALAASRYKTLAVDSAVSIRSGQ